MELTVADDSQKRERDALTFAAWGQRLSLEGYLERESRLRAHPFARDAMTTWLWQGGGRTLASCETFRMASTCRTPGSALEPGWSYGIASVFTEPALRGRGHASGLVEALCERLRVRERASHAALLFSEVGPSIYRRAGFTATPAEDWELPAEQGEVRPPVGKLVGEGELDTALSAIPAPRDAFVVWPTLAQLDWHLERERIYARLLGRSRPRHHGAVVEGAAAVWCANFKEDELTVLLASARSAAGLDAVLRCAQRTAGAARLLRVRVWATPLPFAWSPAAQGEIRPRAASLPMLRPLDARVFPQEWAFIPRALWV